MKRLIILFTFILVITGCSKKEEVVEKKEIKEEVKEEEKYIDENNTDIGIYFARDGKVDIVTEYKTNIVPLKDIAIFQVYPSKESEIKLNTDFGTSFHDAWTSLPNYDKLKIGFNVKYTLESGEEISYNILDYNVVFNELYDYLYDDYANRYNSWYSHIEERDYTEETLYTSIKLFAATPEKINSKILLTVFTYDTLDDFDANGEYRGNSSYTITICDINKTC